MRGGEKLAKLNIKGVVVSNDDKWIYDLFDVEAVSPRDVLEALEEAGSEALEVVINSPGGDVFAGSEIYTAIKEHKGEVTTKIVGIAASMGSVIAMAGDKTLISPTAQIMIHNVSSCAGGDYRDMEHQAEVLKNYNKSIASAYMLKSGMSEEDLLFLMDQESWINAKDALDYGLVDEVMFEEQSPKLAASIKTEMLPQEVIKKVRNMKDVFKPDQSKDESGFLMAKLNLLKLKGDGLVE